MKNLLKVSLAKALSIAFVLNIMLAVMVVPTLGLPDGPFTFVDPSTLIANTPDASVISFGGYEWFVYDANGAGLHAGTAEDPSAAVFMLEKNGDFGTRLIVSSCFECEEKDVVNS